MNVLESPGERLSMVPTRQVETQALSALDKSQPVSVVAKELLALVAPNNNMIKRPVKFDSGFSRHDR